jgi:putative tryptophan/tyrosine transport system substrate-binding protein
MRRRDLLCVLGGTAADWSLAFPFAARAQQARMPKIGVLVAGSPDPQPFWTTFQEALRDLGYVEGKNVQVEFRSAQGNRNRLDELAADLVRANVDILVTWQTPTSTPAKRATNIIPIIMADSGDPIGTGLIESLARPGGNVTGIAGMTAELAGKSVELIRDMIPATKQVAALCNGPDPFSKPFLQQIELGGQTAGIAIKPIILGDSGELDVAFARARADGVDAVIVQPSLPTQRAAELAINARLPAASVPSRFARQGGLVSYGPVEADIFRRAATYVDKILKGANPADLPVEQPTKFELIINLKTAKALGLAVAGTLLARADEVIE